MRLPHPFQRLVEALKKMPGIGPKSAQRMAFHLLRASLEEVQELTAAISHARQQLITCRICFHLGGHDPCEICDDPSRDSNTLCVVSDSKDLLAIERSGSHRGLYHVLGGALSPIDGITPDKLQIATLIDRIRRGNFEEVILALNPTPEGDATITYLSEQLRFLPVRVTRIGLGLPVGAEMDYADELTIGQSFEGRKNVGTVHS